MDTSSQILIVVDFGFRKQEQSTTVMHGDGKKKQYPQYQHTAASAHCSISTPQCQHTTVPAKRAATMTVPKDRENISFSNQLAATMDMASGALATPQPSKSSDSSHGRCGGDNARWF